MLHLEFLRSHPISWLTIYKIQMTKFLIGFGYMYVYINMHIIWHPRPFDKIMHMQTLVKWLRTRVGKTVSHARWLNGLHALEII